jgi:hypothetical protein
MKTRSRLDHHLPQGYLEGFIAPSAEGQLSVFHREEGRWFESGPPGVGAIKGFYDYSEGLQPDQTADQAFRDLETKFAAVRRALVASRFSDWKKELNILLQFAQMLRARAPLFREQSMDQGRRLTFLRIDEILPPQPSKTEPGKLVTPIRYSPYVPTEAELRNKTITDMRTEISKGAAWMSQMQWCLRTTWNPSDPFVTCDCPVVMEGWTPTQAEALQDRRTLVFFPVCWQACLIGSPAKFDNEIDMLGPDDMKKLRDLFLKSATRFVFSPVRIDFLGQ